MFRDWHLFIPKSITVPRQEGYSWREFRADAFAGLTVAIVALPLAMAIAIASGATPAAGLVTCVIAGFLISALGGSRFQIGGPTGAFIVVVYGVIAAHGFDGLLIATLMAGVILVVAGLLRVGSWIKYIPEPVITGFTAGIATIIFTSQIRDLFGLQMHGVPADFIPKMTAFWAARASFAWPAIAISAGALAVIILLRRFAPKAPGFLVAVAGASAAAYALHLPIETLGTRFGGVSGAIPAPHLPAAFSWEKVQSLTPSAFTIAFLAGVESLLSAMVADTMTGRRHRSNCELVAQGIANIVSPLFGGLSATGAIARTATNIRAGARTPFAGMLHALFVLAFMLLLGPLLSYVPLASLAAVLTMVAWNMSERERFAHLLHGPVGDRVVLMATFLLTVFVDLTVAIEVGIVLAALIFMHRMAEATAIDQGVQWQDKDQDDFAAPREAYKQADLPPGVEVLELRGPLFFGAVSRLNDALDAVFPMPKFFILRLREAPLIDASGVGALDRFIRRCAQHGGVVILSEVQPRVRAVLEQMSLLHRANVRIATSYEAALELTTQTPPLRASA
ncbi:MAG: SulP family inorganic anion transporter [Pseudomonadota bacterium]